MQRNFWSLMLALVLVAGTVQAQPVVQIQIVDGDTLYDLQGISSPDDQEYIRLIALNPQLGTESRAFYDDQDRFIVIIREDELLNTEGLGVVVPVVVSLAEVFPPDVTPNITLVPTGTANTGSSWWVLPLQIGVIIAVLAFLAWLAIVLIRNRQRRIANEREEVERLAQESMEEQARQHRLTLDPVTSGLPFVEGGIPSSDTTRLENFFNQQAAHGYAERHNLAPSEVRAERIGPIEAGCIHGEGVVSYRDGREEPRRIPEPGIDAYRARYRMPDGTEHVMHCLEQCMNPIVLPSTTSQGVLHGFTFVLDSEAVSAPAPVTPMPTQAPALARTEAMPQDTTLDVGGTQMILPAGSNVAVNDHELRITVLASPVPTTIVVRRTQDVAVEIPVDVDNDAAATA